ncbi:hypothetical protein, partial [Halomonas sp. S2151]|uniref:hypothetical protein n=1 Tax=Halomonas sp. S2151 TaxID=579478 RepID=UPI0012ECCB9A
MTASNEVESLRERLEKVEAERDALRHVVSEARAMGLLTPSAESGVDHRALCEFARDLPTSLARRDARVKAEALEALSRQLSLNAENARENHYHWSADAMQDASDEALQEAVKCRQQA